MGYTGKAGYRFCDDHINQPGFTIRNHGLEFLALSGVCAGNPLIYVNAVFDTMQIGLLRHIMPGKGLVSWAFAVQSVHLAVL